MKLKNKKRLKEIEKELFCMMDFYFKTGYLDVKKHNLLLEEKMELKTGKKRIKSKKESDIEESVFKRLQKYFLP